MKSLWKYFHVVLFVLKNFAKWNVGFLSNLPLVIFGSERVKKGPAYKKEGPDRNKGSNRQWGTGADLGGGCRGCAPPRPETTCGFLIQLVFCKKKKTKWFIGVEVEQETSAPLLKKILDPPLSENIKQKKQGWFYSRECIYFLPIFRKTRPSFFRVLHIEWWGYTTT